MTTESEDTRLDDALKRMEALEQYIAGLSEAHNRLVSAHNESVQRLNTDVTKLAELLYRAAYKASAEENITIREEKLQ